MRSNRSRLRLAKESLRRLTSEESKRAKGALQDTPPMTGKSCVLSMCRWSACHHSVCDSCVDTDCCIENPFTKNG